MPASAVNLAASALAFGAHVHCGPVLVRKRADGSVNARRVCGVTLAPLAAGGNTGLSGEVQDGEYEGEKNAAGQAEGWGTKRWPEPASGYHFLAPVDKLYDIKLATEKKQHERSGNRQDSNNFYKSFGKF